MNPVVACLGSAEGQEWSRNRARPPRFNLGRPQCGLFADILPDPGDDGTPLTDARTLDPAYDPCGRPVIRETR